MRCFLFQSGQLFRGIGADALDVLLKAILGARRIKLGRESVGSDHVRHVMAIIDAAAAAEKAIVVDLARALAIAGGLASADNGAVTVRATRLAHRVAFALHVEIVMARHGTRHLGKVGGGNEALAIGQKTSRS